MVGIGKQVGSCPEGECRPVPLGRSQWSLGVFVEGGDCWEDRARGE